MRTATAAEAPLFTIDSSEERPAASPAANNPRTVVDVPFPTGTYAPIPPDQRMRAPAWKKS